MAQRLYAVMATCALLAGCETAGRTAETAIVRFEPASPASTRPHRPLREYQVNLVELLDKQLEAGALDDAPWSARGDRPDPYVNSPQGREMLDEQIADIERSSDEPGKSKLRNAVADELFLASDNNCAIYIESLRAAQVGNRTFTDVLAAGLGAAGGLTSPLQNAKVLSSLSALATGYGATFDRDVFATQAVEVIAKAIESGRATTKKALQARYTLASSKWSFGQMLDDIYQYHSACTVERGLEQLDSQVAARETVIAALRSGVAKGANASDIADFIADPSIAAKPADKSPALGAIAAGQAAPQASNPVGDQSDADANPLAADLAGVEAMTRNCLEALEANVRASLDPDVGAKSGRRRAAVVPAAANPAVCTSPNTWVDGFLQATRVGFAKAMAAKMPATGLLGQLQQAQRSIDNDQAVLAKKIADARSYVLARAGTASQQMGATYQTVRDDLLATSAALDPGDPLFSFVGQSLDSYRTAVTAAQPPAAAAGAQTAPAAGDAPKVASAAAMLFAQSRPAPPAHTSPAG